MNLTMNYIEEEIPSGDESVNSVKSLKINNTNKLLTDKDRAKSIDLWITQEKKLNGEFLWPLENSSLTYRRSEYDAKAIKNKVSLKWSEVQLRRPKASTFKGLPKNNQRCMDSSEILADMWSKLDKKYNDDIQSDSESQDSIADEEIKVCNQEM